MAGVRRVHRLTLFVLSCIALVGPAVPAGAQNLTLATAAGGVTVAGANPSWSAGFSTVNGLGLSPSAGVSVITTGVTGGVLYTTPFNLVVSGASGAGNSVVVRTHVSAGFAHPSALDIRICYPAATCTSAASFTSVSSSAAAPTDVISTAVGTGTYAATLALFVSATNGAGAFAGTDSTTLTLRTFRSSNGNLLDTDTLSLGSTVQTAVRLLLAAAGGLALSPGSDFTAAFGSVNGLGIGPAPGLSVVAATGGVVYSTPYAIRPTFAGFLSTTARVNAHVSVDFAHPLVLELRDSADNTTFSAISKLSGSPTLLSSSLTSGANLTRYLGVFVSALNGVSAFTGADNATLRFTLIVP